MAGNIKSMITVRLFGLLSTYGGPMRFEVEAVTVRDALRHAAEMGVDKRLVNGALIFVNGQQLTGITRLRRRLCGGDELALLLPTGGG